MSDSTLYLYTSLTAGSSHIVTATARIETILKANKLPFRAIDVATDEAARKLWGRRSKGKKLPGLVKYGNIVGDLEEIEEWNEFGELRMVVNSAPDLDGMPATSYPVAAPSPPKEPEPKTPKPVTIKIQSPPATKPDESEKKDTSAVLALRQASAEAASKAKSKTDEKKEPETKPEDEQSSSSSLTAKHRKGSVAPELPDTAPESPNGPKRPPLVPEVAAMSSANFHADNAEMMGLVEHHRGLIISADNKEEQDKAVHEIRASISSEDPSGSVAALRKEAAEIKRPSETIEESPVTEDVVAEEKKEEPKEDVVATEKEETKEAPVTKPEEENIETTEKVETEPET
ncbi:Glutaredoxin [Penicillium malachiteum]|uniref:Glutaredoxin n=1 Tax=Penicillium malachiteum TaxID=1324776 RepID=UPI00254817EA|nr:Glutaredoxin [Penicillium malachiteum]KAJ5729687.1 Glutaredoxin [Penicillium malachiteum]